MCNLHGSMEAILTVRDNADAYVNSWLKAVSFVDLMNQRPFRWMKNVYVHVFG